MARKISVYVDEEFHKALKAAASLQGLSLSEFMIRATRRALKAPDRKAVAARMDAIRGLIGTRFSADEIRAMREEGRRS
ncbi:MAG: DUF1778 domain-containing protein [Firmicutes bacterium]|nr:DUF1778 domain-containing protein [Bacillota bacterium]